MKFDVIDVYVGWKTMNNGCGRVISKYNEIIIPMRKVIVCKITIIASQYLLRRIPRSSSIVPTHLIRPGVGQTRFTVRKLNEKLINQTTRLGSRARATGGNI